MTFVHRLDHGDENGPLENEPANHANGSPAAIYSIKLRVKRQGARALKSRPGAKSFSTRPSVRSPRVLDREAPLDVRETRRPRPSRA